MSNKNYLFSQNPWPAVAAQRRELLEEGIIAIDGKRLLNTSVHDLSTYFAESYKFEIPTVQTDKIVVDQREALIEVSGERNKYLDERGRTFTATGTLVEVYVPFEGDAICFDIQPTTFTFNLPRGETRENVLIFHIEGVELVADQVRSQIQQTINEITQNLKYLRTDCERFNGNLYSYAHALIQRRRRRLLSDRNLVADLGFKLKEREGNLQAGEAPEVRNKIVPVLPLAGTTPYRPEPYLATRDYAQILEVIAKMAEFMKLSPSAFATMDEAALRSHFLIRLNGHFAAKSALEAFISRGWSAICIPVQGKSIFIAECNFWSDARRFNDKVDQLLGYSSWRDTKATIILFNRDKPFAQVLQEMQATIKDHSNLKRNLPQLSQTSFPYVFAHHGDRNRELLLTVLAFDVSRTL